MNRREFLKTSAVTSSTLLWAQPSPADPRPASLSIESLPLAVTGGPRLPDLAPARWIWYPSGRTLQNTFILFRNELVLSEAPRRATGWICADSRYELRVNGERVQWGPAPADPRWPEADPLDLAKFLKPGANVIAVTVLFYGTGDGTWPIGKPGFLFVLDLEQVDGSRRRIVSDPSWKSILCRAWQPGRPKRWYLRALQEEFDSRLYPHGWWQPGYQLGEGWLPAMSLGGSPNKPALSTTYYEYTLDPGGGPADAVLRPRSIPLLSESIVRPARLAESTGLRWRVPARDYFDFRFPDAFDADRRECARETGPGEWELDLGETGSAAITFEFKEQVVGWPGFGIEAPTGTEIEVLVQEAHQVGGPALLNTHFDSWSRFICREGRNDFETFDFESLRWLQLHVHQARGKVKIRDVRVRRRMFPWPNEPRIRTSDPALQRLFSASLNTLNNSAQETLVDGMARERQQYSGDGGHQLHGVHLAFGERRLVARYLTTWSQGLTKDGFFLDCWPAYDRLARLVERQLDLTGWGPILDHGVGFNFDCWSHYLYTGELEALREPYPRLVRFATYLQSIVGPDRLLPVENLGIPSVWIDHSAYQRQRHKQCAFNLYVAAALRHALAPICRAFGDDARARAVESFADSLLAAAVEKFWSPDRELFVNNLPWRDEEKATRTCDRSLATSVLFGQCPKGAAAAAVRSLVECPAEMGFSYPANAGWRLWALARAGRADVVIEDLRRRWATMSSVLENNTLQEDWTARPDSGNQWSHCAVAPLYIAYQGLMGLRPIEPGFKRYEIRPQPGNLELLDLAAHTVLGPIGMKAEGRRGDRRVSFSLPPGGAGVLILPGAEAPSLKPAEAPVPDGCRSWVLPSAGELALRLRLV